MATSPAPEDAARYILNIFVQDHNCRAGHVLRINSFQLPFSEPPWQSSDFKVDMEYAAQQGWVDVGDRYSFRLTELGFSKAGEGEMIGSLAKDKVTLVKKDGTVFKDDIPATVSTGEIITFIRDLPIEVGDHFLRPIPNGLVDDYIVTDPGYRSGVGPIPPHFQVKVRRSDAPAAPPQTIIANFHGSNSRINVNSTDSSSNTVIYQTQD